MTTAVSNRDTTPRRVASETRIETTPRPAPADAPRTGTDSFEVARADTTVAFLGLGGGENGSLSLDAQRRRVQRPVREAVGDILAGRLEDAKRTTSGAANAIRREQGLATGQDTYGTRLLGMTYGIAHEFQNASRTLDRGGDFAAVRDGMAQTKRRIDFLAEDGLIDASTADRLRGVADGYATQATEQEALAMKYYGVPAARASGVGQTVPNALRMSELAPVQGAFTGADLAIADQPETFERSGVLLSTIGPVDGREDSTYDFTGEARFYGLSANRTGKPQRNWVAVQNTSDEPLELTVRGTVYTQHVTPHDGSVNPNYPPVGAANPGFQGPHALAAMSFMRAEPGDNGYLERTVTIPPGQTRVVNDTYQERGSETFQILDLTARNPNQTFRLANVASEHSPTASDLANLQNRPAAAGLPHNFNPAGTNALGRPHGVVENGAEFSGRRRVTLRDGTRAGELLFSTRFKNAGATPDLGRLAVTGGVPASSYAHHPNVTNPRNAETADGSYGVTYRRTYDLTNDTDQPLTVDVMFTGPQVANERDRPQGGVMTMPLRIDGVPTPARVSARGDAVLVKRVTVPPHSTRPLTIEATNVGNTVPPAGIELRSYR